MLRRLGVAIAAFAVFATPAYAHKGNPNFRSRVLAAPPGVSVTVIGGDDQLELVNNSKRTVVVRGYDGEPYARIKPSGEVDVNSRSPAAYLNEERFGGVRLPKGVNPGAAPAWRFRDGSHRFQWHDHRMHWMAKTRPDKVTDVGRRTKIFDWKVPVDTAGRPAAIRGDLYWVPAGDESLPAGAFVALAVLALGGGGLVVVVRRRRLREDGADESATEAW